MDDHDQFDSWLKAKGLERETSDHYVPGDSYYERPRKVSSNPYTRRRLNSYDAARSSNVRALRSLGEITKQYEQERKQRRKERLQLLNPVKFLIHLGRKFERKNVEESVSSED